MGHALVQSPTWHALYRGEGFLENGQISKHGELQKALNDVYAVQNGMANLHLLDAGINRSKRHVFTKALKQMYSHKRGGGFDLGHEMEARCHQYFSEHTKAGLDAGDLASRLIKTFQSVEGPLTRDLQDRVPGSSWSASAARTHQERLRNLSESVVQVYEDVGL